MAYIQTRSEVTKKQNMSVELTQDERFDDDDMIVRVCPESPSRIT